MTVCSPVLASARQCSPVLTAWSGDSKSATETDSIDCMWWLLDKLVFERLLYEHVDNRRTPGMSGDEFARYRDLSAGMNGLVQKLNDRRFGSDDIFAKHARSRLKLRELCRQHADNE